MGVPTNFQVCSTFIHNSGRLTYPYSNVEKNVDVQHPTTWGCQGAMFAFLCLLEIQV